MFAILICVIAYLLFKHYGYEERIKFNSETSVGKKIENNYSLTPTFVVKGVTLLRDFGSGGFPTAMYIIECAYPTNTGGSRVNSFQFIDLINTFQVGDVLTLGKVKEMLNSDKYLSEP
jgi:hypothetical protein